MRILLVNKFMYPRGGAETYFLKIGKWLWENGYQVQYFGMYDDKNTVGNERGLAVGNMDFRTGGIKRITYPFRIIYSLEARNKIRRVCESFKPDIVHLNNINFQLTPSVIDAVYGLGIPIIQTVHDSQMVCPSHLMMGPESGELCQRCVNGSKWNCARYNCIHGSKIKSVLGSIEAELYRYRKNYDRVDLYICPSKFMESVLLKEERFRGKTAVLQNFVSKPEPGYRPVKGDYVLYFGRLSEEKGIAGFLEACRRLPDIHFIIAGSGPAEEMVTREKPENVNYVGFKSGDELNELIAGAKFSFYPSIWHENCPLSVLESISLGTPVLASGTGGIPELIEAGKTGVLMEGTGSGTYASEIRKLYDDKKLLDKMTEECRNKSDFITLDDYCERLIKIYGKFTGCL